MIIKIVKDSRQLILVGSLSRRLQGGAASFETGSSPRGTSEAALESLADAVSRSQAIVELNRVRLQVISIINLDYIVCRTVLASLSVSRPVFNTSWIFAGAGLVNLVSW